MFERVKEAIRRLVSGPGEKPFNCEARALEVQVECGRCGEVITVRVDRDHEIEPQYAPDAEEGDHPVRWVLRKEVVGRRCQNIINQALGIGLGKHEDVDVI